MSCVIKPFAATHYNQLLIKDISSVVCPPYDVINKAELARLRNRSPYNFSRVLLASHENYQKIAERFSRWIEEKVLVKDSQDNLYLYEQRFKYRRRHYRRFGILSLLHMDKGVIYPHEHTLAKPKEDRKKVIQKTKANLSPIFVIVPERLKALSRLSRSLARQKPFLRFRDFEGNENFLWKVKKAEAVKKISREIERHKLVIADGHHRFEVARDYYRKNRGRFKDLHYILAYITGPQRGLLVLPAHRIAALKGDNFISALGRYFSIEKTAREALAERLRSSKNGFSLGIYRKKKFYFLRLKKRSLLDKMPGEAVYRKLDPYILHKFVFPLLRVRGKISYAHSAFKAEKMAKGNRAAFFLRPTPLKIIFTLADKHLRLPQKSTYFYPKVAAGAVVRRFEKQ